MAYEELSDEDKIKQSIDFVAIGQPLPEVYITFLREMDLYDLIVNPRNSDANAIEIDPVC